MGSGGGPLPVPFTVAMTGEGGVSRLVDPLSFLLLHSWAPGSVFVLPGGPARPPVESRPPAWPQPLLRTRRGLRGEQAAAAVFPSSPARFTSVSWARQDGWGVQASRPAPAGQCIGRAAHLVPSSSAVRPQGSAAGARSRPPQGLSPFFQPAAHAISSAIGLASAQPSASRSPSCFPFPGSARSPRGHKMQDLRFFAVRDPPRDPPRDPGSQGCPKQRLSAPLDRANYGRMTEGSRALSECDRHLDARSHAPTYLLFNESDLVPKRGDMYTELTLS
ncbi:hypothetical protein NDU88_002364 [Pleurodeles waltl]|uniref:Uncharacterized protein n=1 Tax=Pleurodeles waltl TaxID=8319 RepID=A0AAV7MMF7_PLEWA|nr:hypothetical protein NDU88_002364 [Pleurodeles waltl]